MNSKTNHAFANFLNTLFRVFSLLFVCSGLAHSTECEPFLEPHVEFLPKSFYVKGVGQIEAGYLCMAGGPCLVVINQPELLGRHQAMITTSHVIIGPETRGRMSEKYFPEFGDFDPKINCHGFACWVSRIPGIKKNMWIEYFPDPVFGKIPLKIILTSYYNLIGSIKPSEVDAFSKRTDVQEHDLLVLVHKERFVHSALVIKENTENWTVSKIGEGAVVEAPLENLLTPYPVESILHYRRR